MKYFDLLHFYPLKLQFEGLFNTQTTYFKAKICIYDIFLRILRTDKHKASDRDIKMSESKKSKHKP